MERAGRGDGIGIELTRGVVRGVLLAADEPDRLRAATEVGIRHFDDDRSVLDALIRLRAELGPSRAPTRVALFPPGCTLHRVDVTSLSGPELNVTRSRLLQVDGVSSTVLIDDGPRRWLFAVRWDDRSCGGWRSSSSMPGSVDVAIDPSPVALSRLLVDSVMARRDAALGESFEVVLAGRADRWRRRATASVANRPTWSPRRPRSHSHCSTGSPTPPTSRRRSSRPPRSDWTGSRLLRRRAHSTLRGVAHRRTRRTTSGRHNVSASPSVRRSAPPDWRADCGRST